jgi:hypothetical protein
VAFDDRLRQEALLVRAWRSMEQECRDYAIGILDDHSKRSGPDIKDRRACELASKILRHLEGTRGR